MKELNRTDRLTIAAILFAVILLIGLITLKDPEVKYSRTAEETLNVILNPNDVIEQADLYEALKKDGNDLLLVDLRSPAEYRKAHVEHAVNIPIQEILIEENQIYFEDLHKKKTIILYGNDQLEPNGVWLLMKQTGFDNIRVMEGGFHTYSLIGSGETGATEMQSGFSEKPIHNYREVLSKFGSSTGSGTNTAPEPVKMIKKEKKSSAEGGC